MSINIFSDFDFNILDDPDFEESSVREEIISPLLKSLNYKAFGRNKIIREKSVTHPFVQTGSGKRELKNYPDYLLEVDGCYSWVLDAKDPNENIKSGKNKEQVYFYAIHPEIRVNYYGLCNGKEFILFHISHEEPLIYFQLDEIEHYWDKVKNIISPDAFVQNQILNEEGIKYEEEDFDYAKIQMLGTLPVKKRAARRHFGVHGYFTKQAWNVVQEYIKNFTKPNDVVLDPFGGSGVTAIEALMTGRKGINIDLNPMSTFIVDALTTPVKFESFISEFKKLETIFNKKAPKTDEEITLALDKYPYPKGIRLMKNADVEFVEQLFNNKQLAQLAFLKYHINKIKDEGIRKSLLLVFSTSLNKLNLTYHNSNAASPNAGDSGPMRYYRYRIAKEPIDLDVWETFKGKFDNIYKAKQEILPAINSKTIHNLSIRTTSATNLDFIKTESVDYIYTDPPYADKIPYLDLSAMWNAWLDFEISEKTFKEEVIEGGERKKTSDEYFKLLEDSMKEMFRVLKFDRWMSFVFAHKNPKYWHFIVDTAEKIGFEYAGSVKQENGQTSYKKRTMSYSVLAGQLIINFKKVKTPQVIQKTKLGAEVYDIIIETIESVIAENDGATLEEINDKLIMNGLELGFLDILSKEYKDLTPLLNSNFDYHQENETFHIHENKKFKTNIPLDLRIRYFLLSYLRRKHNKNDYPTTDEIVLDIMPLLKNGITPENQTILKVLEKIADHIGNNRWKIKQGGQQTLFD